MIPQVCHGRRECSECGWVLTVYWLPGSRASEKPCDDGKHLMMELESLSAPAPYHSSGEVER